MSMAHWLMYTRNTIHSSLQSVNYKTSLNNIHNGIAAKISFLVSCCHSFIQESTKSLIVISCPGIDEIWDWRCFQISIELGYKKQKKLLFLHQLITNCRTSTWWYLTISLNIKLFKHSNHLLGHKVTKCLLHSSLVGNILPNQFDWYIANYTAFPLFL